MSNRENEQRRIQNQRAELQRLEQRIGDLEGDIVSWRSRCSALEEMMEDTLQKPQQPTYTDESGILRYRANPIIRFLLDSGNVTVNQIAVLPGVTIKEQIQFHQLLGTSVCGVGDMFPEEDED